MTRPAEPATPAKWASSMIRPRRPALRRWHATSTTACVMRTVSAVTILHIQPGQPQQNAYIERYNRTVRHEWLDRSIIESIDEAQDHGTQWL